LPKISEHEVQQLIKLYVSSGFSLLLSVLPHGTLLVTGWCSRQTRLHQNCRARICRRRRQSRY
jgi:hypothetical protein